MAQKLIIDVSSHDGKLDWKKLKPEIAGAIIRCGYGSDYVHQDDKWYAYNVEECTKLGIPFGVYLYSYAKTSEMIESEMVHMRRLLEGVSPTLPVFIDLEEPGTEKCAAYIADRFVTGMTIAGYKAGVYANLNWWRNYLKDVKTDYKWIAQYNSKLTYDGDDWFMWQFSEDYPFATGKHDASRINPNVYKNNITNILINGLNGNKDAKIKLKLLSAIKLLEEAVELL